MQQRKRLHCIVTHFPIGHADFCNQKQKNHVTSTFKIKYSRLVKSLKNERPTWYHLLFYFTSYVLNMFRTLIYPSSGICDCVVEIPHLSSCSKFVVLEIWCTTQNQPHQISNTQRTENKTTDVVIQQHNRKHLMMDILMSETC